MKWDDASLRDAESSKDTLHAAPGRHAVNVSPGLPSSLGLNLHLFEMRVTAEDGGIAVGRCRLSLRTGRVRAGSALGSLLHV